MHDISEVTFHEQDLLPNQCGKLFVQFYVKGNKASAYAIYDEHLIIQHITSVCIEGKESGELGHGRIAYFLSKIVQEQLLAVY